MYKLASIKHLLIISGASLAVAVIGLTATPETLKNAYFAAVTQAQGETVLYREASKTSSAKKPKQPVKKAQVTRKSPKLIEEFYATKLAQSGVKLRPGTDHRTDSNPTETSSRRCKSTVYRTLESLPEGHRKELKELTLFYTKDGRRGLGGNGGVVLRCLAVADGELAAVFIHEMGHLVDGTYLTGASLAASGFMDFDIPVAADDPSAMFYALTWDNEKQMKSGASYLDFVSLYAMTDPFEDFAETYTYYRLHGAEFRKLAEFNETLAQKYDFMRLHVFDGREFGTSTYGEVEVFKRSYDVTVLPFPLSDLFS